MVTKRSYSSNFTAKNVPFTFQMERNGTFIENFKYENWILHKKLVRVEIFTTFHKSTHISLKYHIVVKYGRQIGPP